MAAVKPLVMGTSGPKEPATLDNVAVGPAVVQSITGASYTIKSTDNNSILVLTNSAAITLTVPSALTAGFTCTIVQGGAGAITVVAASGGTVSNQDGYTKTTGQYGVMFLLIMANSDGASASAVLVGARA